MITHRHRSFLIRRAHRKQSMFEVAYLFVLALAALPLAYTLLQQGGGNHVAFVHRLYRDAAYILAAVLGIVCLEAALGISLENYWFEELGQSHRFWLSIEYRVGIFLCDSALGRLVRRSQFAGCCVVRFRLFRAARRGSSVLQSRAWSDSLRRRCGFRSCVFSAQRPQGVADPVFSKDLSFYLLTLPLYDDIVDIVITILFVTLALWLIIGLAFLRRATAVIHRSDDGENADASRSVAVYLADGGPHRRSGYATAWCWERCYALRWQQAGSWPAITSSPTAIRRSSPARPMPTSVSGYRDTTWLLFVGWRPL